MNFLFYSNEHGALSGKVPSLIYLLISKGYETQQTFNKYLNENMKTQKELK